MITSVDRDDLRDGGAEHFADCICARSRQLNPGHAASRSWCRTSAAAWNAPCDIYRQRRRTCSTTTWRPCRGCTSSRGRARTTSGRWTCCRRSRSAHPGVPTKSGLMLGLGETDEEVIETMRDLREHEVDMLTLGQYLQPSAQPPAGAALRAPGRPSPGSPSKARRWASRTSPAVRWCARPTTPTSRPTATRRTEIKLFG